jgi:hypothetical protein
VLKTSVVLILLAAISITVGCGVKAPPVVPNQPAWPRINDLSGVREDSTILLSWTHPAGHPAVTGYVVLQAKVDISQDACPGCPQDFQEIATVNVPPGSQKGPVTLNSLQSLENGFKYTFVVKPFQASDARGPGSNPVVVEIEGPA